MFANALAAMRLTLAKMAGDKMTYARGTNQAVIIASAGKSTFETTNDAGLAEEVQSDDWLVAPEELILAGEPIEPRHGDQITLQDGRVFEVMAIANQPPWRWSDQFRTWYRIHSKQVA
jgi:hypothetical protein